MNRNTTAIAAALERLDNALDNGPASARRIADEFDAAGLLDQLPAAMEESRRRTDLGLHVVIEERDDGEMFLVHAMDRRFRAAFPNVPDDDGACVQSWHAAGCPRPLIDRQEVLR